MYPWLTLRPPHTLHSLYLHVASTPWYRPVYHTPHVHTLWGISEIHPGPGRAQVTGRGWSRIPEAPMADSPDPWRPTPRQPNPQLPRRPTYLVSQHFSDFSDSTKNKWPQCIVTVTGEGALGCWDGRFSQGIHSHCFHSGFEWVEIMSGICVQRCKSDLVKKSETPHLMPNLHG